MLTVSGSVQASVAMSGSSVADWADLTKGGKDRVQAFGATLGCSTGSIGECLECIKATPFASIVQSDVPQSSLVSLYGQAYIHTT